VGISRIYLLIKAAISSLKDSYDQVPHILPKTPIKPCGWSIDAHFQDGVWSILLSLLAITAANTSCMTMYNLLPPRSPKIHHQQLLTLH